MRRNLLLIATVLYATISWSQTMNIHYKNGQTVQYNMNNIDYVEYTEDNPNNAQVSSGEAVDLGLSVLWASCNVGATSPEEFGDKYAWGETETKDTFTESNYIWYDPYTLTFADIGKDISGTEFDVARVKWGGDWRMPTYAELSELKSKCTWIWANVNSVNGFKVTGQNGNSIFIPVQEKCILWTSTLYSEYQGTFYTAYCQAFSTTFSSGSNVNNFTSRHRGNYIRPVKSK